MDFSKEVLQQIANKGGEEVSKSFSKLSKEEVTVETSVAELVSYDFIVDNITTKDEHAVITYAQMIGGVEGVSLLSMDREAALSLVDLLNQQEVGTTGVLMDLDRSAVKETLNILSNSYLNYLARIVNTELMFSEPYMMTASNVNNIVSQLKGKNVDQGDSVLSLRTVLLINKHRIKANLYILFNKKIVELIKSVNNSN